MLKIVKIGGNIVDNAAKLSAFLTDFAALADDKILVHGGGKIATEIAKNLGIETRMVAGRRVTDQRTLDVVTMVYNGINKQIVSALQARGCNAVGLCGADGKLIVSRRRPPVEVAGERVDYGMVGDPVAVNIELVRQLTAAGMTLVVAPITLDENAATAPENPANSPETARLLNTNADTVAQILATEIARAGTRTQLVYCFEKRGVLLDVEDENSLVPHLDRARFEELKTAGKIHSGMLPKLENAFAAIEKGVSKVVVCAAENIARPDYGGTVIS